MNKKLSTKQLINSSTKNLPDDVVVSVRSVSKKFCRNLRRSMAYGIGDLAKNLAGFQPDSTNLKKDEFWALQDISFELRRGEVLGLIGVNGSGKTTLLRLLSGIFPPDKGEIAIKGRVGALIALGAGFHPHMTGRENVYLNGSILGLSRFEIDDQFDSIVKFSEIGEFINAPVSTYSSGMRVRLGFSIATVIRPDVLLVDEVLAVGDIGFRIKCFNAIANLVNNTAVIFVSHTMQQISFISSKVMVLNNGKIEYNDNDVGKGIDYYISKFENPEQNVSGSGKAIISNVIISNGRQRSGEKEKLFLEYGDNLTIEMNLMLDASVKQPAIKLIIWDRELRPIADCFSQFCGLEMRPKKQSKITLKIKNMQLNMGIYSLIISAVDLSNNETLFRNENVATLQMETLYTSWAPILLDGEWNQE